MQSKSSGTASAISGIDVHAHYGTYVREPARPAHAWMTGSPEVVLRRAARANVRITVVSPLAGLLPRGRADAFAANEQAAEEVSRQSHLRQWVVVNPLQPATFAQAERMLGQPQCVGIKIHPEEHGYAIADHGRELFALADACRAVVLTHSGEVNSLPADFLPFADAFPRVRLILGHLGCGHDGDLTHQVRAIARAAHGNLYVDTSSASSIISGLLEWAVDQVGADRILFGTDSPLYSAATQRARVDQAEIPLADKRRILHDNAAKLLDLPE